MLVVEMENQRIWQFFQRLKHRGATDPSNSIPRYRENVFREHDSQQPKVKRTQYPSEVIDTQQVVYPINGMRLLSDDKRSQALTSTTTWTTLYKSSTLSEEAGHRRPYILQAHFYETEHDTVSQVMKPPTPR